MTKVRPQQNRRELETTLCSHQAAERHGTRFPRESGLVELPRSFLRPPLILSLVLQRDFLSLWEVSMLVFQRPKKKKKVKKEDLQKQVPSCPFAHSCRKKSQELLMNVPAVCGKSAKLSLWAFVSLLRSLF